MTTTNLYSDDLTCPSCIGKIERRLLQLDGVERASVHMTSGRIAVVHDAETAPVEALVDAVRDAGYTATPRGF